MTGAEKDGGGKEFGLRNNLLLNQCFSNLFTFFAPGQRLQVEAHSVRFLLGQSASVGISVLGVSAYKWLGK